MSTGVNLYIQESAMVLDCIDVSQGKPIGYIGAGNMNVP